MGGKEKKYDQFLVIVKMSPKHFSQSHSFLHLTSFNAEN